jgi:hypothetical protein
MEPLMKKVPLLALFSLLPSWALANEVSCIVAPDEKASVNVIYLHGRGRDPIGEESGERRDVRKIAERLGLRVAMVLSPDRNEQDERLWKREDLAAMRGVWEEAVKKSESCFEGGRPTAILAFSSGGYFVNKLFQAGDLADYEWVLSVGAGGDWMEAIEEPSRAGRLIIWFGAEEESFYFDASAAYAARLKEQGYDVQFQAFEGGHVLPTEAIGLP